MPATGCGNIVAGSRTGRCLAGRRVRKSVPFCSKRSVSDLVFHASWNKEQRNRDPPVPPLMGSPIGGPPFPVHYRENIMCSFCSCVPWGHKSRSEVRFRGTEMEQIGTAGRASDGSGARPTEGLTGRTRQTERSAEVVAPRARNPSTVKTTPEATTLALSQKHATYLTGQGIDSSVAVTAGCYTASFPADLPPELAWCADVLPGIVFSHSTLDGRTIPQYRADDPGSGPKYVFPKGCGTFASVHPTMAARIGFADRLVIVEGTKQYLSAVGYASLTDLVVGVQGCRSWLSDGAPIADFDLLTGAVDGVTSVTSAVIVFDGDRKTNRSVYDAAEMLRDHLGIIGIDAVTYASLPAGGKAGLDDYLAGRPVAGRAIVFERLLASASTKPGRPPAVRKQSLATTGDLAAVQAVVDELKGVIRDVPQQHGDTLVQGPCLLGAAVRIVRTTTLVDDLDTTVHQVVTHDLEVMIGTGEDRLRHVIRDVPDSDLGSPSKWLTQTPNARGTRIHVATGSYACGQIASAIRTHRIDDTVEMVARRQTGWRDVNGVPAYVHAGGALSADGQILTTRAELDSLYNLISYPDPTALPPETVTGAVRSSLTVGTELMHDGTAWTVLLGSMAHAYAGPRPKACIFLVGGGGSGKSVVLGTAMSFQAPEYHYDGLLMANVDSTANAIADSGRGLDHGVIGIDDVRSRGTGRRQEAQDEGVEAKVRTSYAGGSAGRRRLHHDSATGETTARNPDFSSPLVVFGGERLPSAEVAPTTVQRILSVSVKAETSLKEGAKAEMVRLGSDGTMQRAWAGYIRWLAEQIAALQDGGGGAGKAIKDWIALLDARRAEIEQTLVVRLPGAAPRTREVPASTLVGIDLYLTYAESIGAITADEQKSLAAEMVEQVITAVQRHAAVELGRNIDPAETVLERLRSLVASGKYAFTTSPTGMVSIGATCLGRRDGGTVAILPPVASDALGGTDIKKALATVTLADARGNPTRSITVGGVKVRCCVVSDAVWDGTAAHGDDEPGAEAKTESAA